MTHVVGIDLGTTNSVVAYLENGKPQVMQNAEGGKTTPSVVLYKNDAVLVGELAKRQRMLNPDRTIYSIKRFVGCRWDESDQRRQGIAFHLVPGPDGLVAVRIDDRKLLPEQVQAEILRKMKATAEEYLGEPILQAVITCPAYFNDSQRQATIKAAELAGLETLRIINEPTAAALAYGLGKAKNQKIAVFDFGGGTFDISILEIDEDIFEVKATCGDTFLGGDSIDRILTDWIVEEIRRSLDMDLSENIQAMSRIAETAEKIKCELSSLEETTISLPFIGADASGPKHFTAELSRAAFEAMIAPTLARLKPPCEQVLADAKLRAEDLGAVILVGGSTRIPAVQRLVKDLFGRDPDCSVSPDEAVSLGAAIQGAIMRGDLDEILLLDVTPLSLGIELAGGLFSPLIPRNSSIPTTAKKKFTTVRDSQSRVRIHVLQGERRKASENRTLARFSLEGIAPAPREVPEIEVGFTLDANGILQVAAMDLTTGSIHQVKIESYQAVFDSEVERIVSEAGVKADEDRQFARKVAVRRRLDEMRQDLTRQLQEGAVRAFTEDEERRIKEAFFRVDAALAGDDWAVIDAAERMVKYIFCEVMLPRGLTSNVGDVTLSLEDAISQNVTEKRQDTPPAPSTLLEAAPAGIAAAPPVSSHSPAPDFGA